MKLDIKKSSLLLVVCSLFASPYAFSQQDDAVLQNDPINLKQYHGDPMNIEGYKSEVHSATDGELEAIKSEVQKQRMMNELNKEKVKKFNELQRSTEKLQESTEEMIDTKIESQKAIVEHNKKMQGFQKRLECLEKNNWDKTKCPKDGKETVEEENAIALAQQNAMKEQSLPEKDVDDLALEKKFTALLFAGSTFMNGTFAGKDDTFEASYSTGLRFESKLTDRFILGAGITYTKMEIKDLRNMYTSMFSSYYNPGYFMNNWNRKIDYTNYGLDVFGKFYLILESRFRPYIGAGVNLSRTSMDFESRNNNFAFSGNPYIDYGYSGYKSTNIGGELALGADFLITKTFGLNLDFKYFRNFVKSGNKSSRDILGYYPNYNSYSDQYLIRELGDEVDSSNNFVLTAGLTLSF